MATVEQIKELRNQTQVSVKLCHDALVATGNDMEKAKLWLRQKGSEVAGEGNAFDYSLVEDGVEKLHGVADGTGFQYKTDKVSVDIRGFDGSSPRTLWGSDRCMLECRPARA
jgi:hypothetical protein